MKYTFTVLKKRARTISYFFMAFFMFLVFPCILFLLLSSNTNKIFGIQSFVVLTGSMEPNIHQGSILFTKKNSTYNKGEVIAFKEGDKVITHRIAAVKGNKTHASYITQGDANNTADTSSVPIANVLGEGKNSIPSLGNFILLLKTVPGFLLFLCLPVLIFIGFEVWNIKKEIELSIERKVKERLGTSV